MKKTFPPIGEERHQHGKFRTICHRNSQFESVVDLIEFFCLLRCGLARCNMFQCRAVNPHVVREWSSSVQPVLSIRAGLPRKQPKV